MTDTAADVAVERPRLISIAFRLLGTLADAEDAVQETFARWYRLSPDERGAIRNPQAWLTRVVGRIGLDALGSARARREEYVGEWLPEPLPADHELTAAADPAARAERADAVSTALLVVLERMTPAERVAFVLHDAFAVPFDEIAALLDRSPAAARQLATSARRRLASEPTHVVPRSEHDAVVAAFGRACAEGDLAGLLEVLGQDVVLRSDGGGVVSAARRPVVGAENVARFILGVLAKNPSARVEDVETADGAAFLVRDGDGVLGILNLGVRGAVAGDVWIVMNPAKLGAWG
ncbi:RNA polymerase sigma factor SigJ [Microbacterium oryzae]|uniref:RNA polymerase sigma factor SigJ n=1 Tax=Microbacterium oryzae TaxID=743009 RepID=UPI0025B0CDA7|nr:RNA polymerase sigma factor SigJ [Microbacterium oryzae]MDN3310442.1 RNA polymerase sigma factor SigJ [Microbacterium oryzae]